MQNSTWGKNPNDDDWQKYNIIIGMSDRLQNIVHKMQVVIVAIHDVKGWIVVIQVLGNLLSTIDCTAKWKQNKYEVFVWL